MNQDQKMKLWVADFGVFGRRTRRSTRTYTHAYACLCTLQDPVPMVGFSRTRELAEKQISMRRSRGWTGPFEIVETKEITAS